VSPPLSHRKPPVSSSARPSSRWFRAQNQYL
jgi:hypothetical protein